MSKYMSIHVSTYMSTQMSMHMSTYMFTHTSTYMSIHMSVNMSTPMFIRMSIRFYAQTSSDSLRAMVYDAASLYPSSLRTAPRGHNGAVLPFCGLRIRPLITAQRGYDHQIHTPVISEFMRLISESIPYAIINGSDPTPYC